MKKQVRTIPTLAFCLLMAATQPVAQAAKPMPYEVASLLVGSKYYAVGSDGQTSLRLSEQEAAEIGISKAIYDILVTDLARSNSVRRQVLNSSNASQIVLVPSAVPTADTLSVRESLLQIADRLKMGQLLLEKQAQQGTLIPNKDGKMPDVQGMNKDVQKQLDAINAYLES